MAVREIKNLNELIFTFVDKSKFVSASVSKLTAPGENYCSELLALDISTRSSENPQIHTVAKLLPENEFARKIFKSERTFLLETLFYEKITQSLRNFQKEQGFTQLIDSFPQFCTARFNLENGREIDENAVLVIKNLKNEGFGILDRKIGFDLEGSRVVLRKIAELHATVFAMKQLKPEEFEKVFGEVFQEYVMYEAEEEEAKIFTESLVKLVKDDDLCEKNIEKIRENVNTSCNTATKKNNKELKCQFGSLIHYDLWTNNILVKTENEKIIDLKFIDFQIIEYGSVTRDLVFFLFTSVQLQVIQKEIDNLVKFYFENFISFLEKLKCDVSSLKFEDFLAEMALMAKKTELSHILLMLRPIYKDEKSAKEVKNMEREDFLQTGSQDSYETKQKACYVVHEFIKRWL